VTTVFYLIVFAFLLPSIGWWIFTLSRRRNIHNARVAPVGRA